MKETIGREHDIIALVYGSESESELTFRRAIPCSAGNLGCLSIQLPIHGLDDEAGLLDERW